MFVIINFAAKVSDSTRGVTSQAARNAQLARVNARLGRRIDVRECAKTRRTPEMVVKGEGRKGCARANAAVERRN